MNDLLSAFVSAASLLAAVEFKMINCPAPIWFRSSRDGGGSSVPRRGVRFRFAASCDLSEKENFKLESAVILKFDL